MPRSYTTPVRSAQAAASRRRILDAALRLFSRDGYAATTLSAIADEAGVSAETIYKHFRNKPTVLQQLLAREVTGNDAGGRLEGVTDELVQQLAAEPDPVERLRAFCGLATRVYENTATLQRAFTEAARVNPELEELWRSNRLRRLQDMRAVLGVFAEDASLILPLETAGDLMWTLASPEVFTLLVHERGWEAPRYERWLYASLHVQLLGSPARDVDGGS
jgi:AcrR family transcriptional regulator